MSCISIKTGSAMSYASADGGVGAIKAANRSYLFDPLSPLDSLHSPWFIVDPGRVALIETYNYPDGYEIYVDRVVIGSYLPSVVESCDCNKPQGIGGAGMVLARSRMTLGAGSEYWKINDSRRQLLIQVPGAYQLELQDLAMLGSMEVTLVYWDAQLVPHLPAAYNAGITPNV